MGFRPKERVQLERLTGLFLEGVPLLKHSAGDALSWEADALPTELLPRGL
jgi:hypothetical protein